MPMAAIDKRIKELEALRTRLHEALMRTRTTEEANKVERELWAVREALMRYKLLRNLETEIPKE